jgi:hypothetical protein
MGTVSQNGISLKSVPIKFSTASSQKFGRITHTRSLLLAGAVFQSIPLFLTFALPLFFNSRRVP